MNARAVFSRLATASTIFALGGAISSTAALADDLPVQDSAVAGELTPLTAAVAVEDRKAASAKDETVLYGAWARSIEVDSGQLEDDVPTFTPSFADGLEATQKSEKMSGFYSLRYSVYGDAPFSPYAGAGVGVVMASEQKTGTGALAARAVAGFTVTVDDKAAFYAEYAFLKSSGSTFGTGSAVDLPDDEHSLKLGFRRTF